MGFYDPCPGDPKLLLVEYTFHGRKYKVENAVTSSYLPPCGKCFFYEQIFLTAWFVDRSWWMTMRRCWYHKISINFETVPECKAASKRFWVTIADSCLLPFCSLFWWAISVFSYSLMRPVCCIHMWICATSMAYTPTAANNLQPVIFPKKKKRTVSQDDDASCLLLNMA